MPGRRLIDPFLVNTTYPEAVSNNAELLTDWDGLVYARPIPIKLIGNSWFQGSYDLFDWDNFVKDDHNYLRVSTDGGDTWRVINLCAGGDDHPPVTIGSPDGGLEISGDDTQVLTLDPASTSGPGSMSINHYIKLEALKFDYLDNVGTGAEVYKDYTTSGDTRTHNLRTLISSDSSITITENTNTIDLTTEGGTGGVDNTMINIGTGEGIYKQKDIYQFQLKTLIGGDNITLTDNGDDITIDAIDTNYQYTAISLGTNDIYKETVSNEFRFRGLVAGANVTLTELANDIQIDFSDTTGSGEVNTMTNIGSGSIEWYKQKNGVQFEIKTLDEITSGDTLNPYGHITFDTADSGDTVLIGTTAELNTAANVGSGEIIYKEKIDEEFKFKTLVAGTGVTLTSGTDTLQIDATGVGGGEVNTITNVGGGIEIFQEPKTGVNFNLRTLIAGDNINLTQNTNTIEISGVNNYYDVDNLGTTVGLIYKDTTGTGTDADPYTFNFRGIRAGTGVNVSSSDTDIIISATGVTNTGENVGTLGYGPYDGYDAPKLQFRNIATNPLTDVIEVTLDDTDNNILLNIVEENIDHEVLENVDPNEHVDHTTVNIIGQEGVLAHSTGLVEESSGKDITDDTILTLAFEDLTEKTEPQNADLFAFYRPIENTHYHIT